MNNSLAYRGYHAKIEYDAESMVLYGKIDGIKDLVNFQSNSATGIEEEFHSAVDDYLAFCEEIGQAPDKEYSGNFNVRISSELHQKMSLKAAKEGRALNAIMSDACKQYLENEDRIKAEESKPAKFASMLWYREGRSKSVLDNYSANQNGGLNHGKVSRTLQ